MNRMQHDLEELGGQLWPDADTLRPRSLEDGESPRRRVPAFVALLLAATLIAGIVIAGTIVLRSRSTSLKGTADARPAPVVPWLDEPAPNVASPFTKPGVGPCTASMLAITVKVPNASYIGAGPINTSFWDVTARDRASVACYVSQGFDVRFTTASGTLALKRSPYLATTDIAYLWPLAQPPPAGYASEADGEIDSGSPCGALPPITSMLLSPGPGLGTAVVSPGPAGGSGTPCAQAREYYSELQAFGGGSPYVSLTEASLQSPATVHPGERVHFLTTIYNIAESRHCLGIGPRVPGCGAPNPVLSFQPCPSFHTELEGVEGTFHTYVLNCGAAHSLANRESETFDMYIDIPSDARSGPAVLTWAIDGDPTMFGSARAAVWVTA